MIIFTAVLWSGGDGQAGTGVWKCARVVGQWHCLSVSLSLCLAVSLSDKKHLIDCLFSSTQQVEAFSNGLEASLTNNVGLHIGDGLGTIGPSGYVF